MSPNPAHVFIAVSFAHVHVPSHVPLQVAWHVGPTLPPPPPPPPHAMVLQASSSVAKDNFPPHNPKHTVISVPQLLWLPWLPAPYTVPRDPVPAAGVVSNDCTCRSSRFSLNFFMVSM